MWADSCGPFRFLPREAYKTTQFTTQKLSGSTHPCPRSSNPDGAEFIVAGLRLHLGLQVTVGLGLDSAIEVDTPRLSVLHSATTTRRTLQPETDPQNLQFLF